MRKVLLIAFIYPPLGGSGVQRTLKFTKYLPDLGWQLCVVCSDDPHVFNHGLDHTLVDDIPSEVKVCRHPFISPLGLRRWVQKMLGMEKRHGSTSTDLVPAKQMQGTDSYGQKSPFLNTLAAPLRPFEFPPIDAAIYWSLAIIPFCLKLIRKERIDLIFSTSFPYSDHVTGYVLKKLTGKPWVADFRDPWTQHAAAHNHGWRHKIDQWVEQHVLRTADRVIGVTPSETQGLSDLAPGRDPANFITIENGYDEADFPSDEVDQADKIIMENDRVTLSHVGILYDGTVLTLLQALALLGKAGECLTVRFVGGLPGQELAWLAEHPLDATVEVLKRVPHPEAIRHMQTSDVLLLIFGSGVRWQKHYPGKLFEYMRCGRPILMIGPEGDAARLLAASGTGCFVDATDIQGIADALRLLIEQPAAFKDRCYQPAPAVIAQYERRKLTSRLVEVFDRILSK